MWSLRMLWRSSEIEERGMDGDDMYFSECHERVGYMGTIFGFFGVFHAWSSTWYGIAWQTI